MVRMEQDVVVHRSLVADQTQVRFHPRHAVPALGVGGHVAAGVLFDLVPDFELPVLGVVDGGAELDPPALPRRLLPRCVRLHQRVVGMFLEHALNPLDVVPGGEDVVVHQELFPVADPERRFRFQRPQMDMGRPRLLLGGHVGGGQKATHCHFGENFQMHVDSRPFGAKSGLAATPDWQND